ncbi:Tim44 domain-containing protein [Iodobacter ciconiae]|uniref:Tim44 domain-containing protein n=1 Tax=Iodobacter ciconiae TaxID=2496266 RepID=A0A3S8ZQL1_9NEIS|nr:Tim44-like domain-containing protein [Iodobacter ciconiae]AZN35757.1 Tim44 domain-containing protein [Iodobacter ciconiae]
MSQFSRTLMVTLLTASLFASGIAEAKRVGGGRSSGMQRSQTTRPAAPPPQRNVAPAQQPGQAAQPQRSGMGSIIGGVAAGALGGYLLGNLFNSNNASGASESSGGGFPWGLLLLLGAGGYFAMRMMRRRKEAAVAAGPAFASMPNNEQTDRIFRMGDQVAPVAPAAAGITRLPDGTETAAFLRQARGSFMHMQTLHSAEQVNEMRKYLTPELFNELSQEISGNEEPAEFPELNAELVDCATEEGRMVSSVRFYGKVSESLHSAPVPFQEIWHFIRPIHGDPRWMVAGIQQL